MLCPKCGVEVSSGSRFCAVCGTAVAPATAASGYAPVEGAWGAPPPPGSAFPPYAGQAPVGNGRAYGGRLVRPRHPRMIAGVCSGIALYYGWDVTLIRIVTVVVAILFAVVLVPILYAIAWIIVPEAPNVLPPGRL